MFNLLQWLDHAGFGLSPTPVRLDEPFEYLQCIDGADQFWPLLPFIQSLDGARASGAFARQLQSRPAAYVSPDNAHL